MLFTSYALINIKKHLWFVHRRHKVSQAKNCLNVFAVSQTLVAAAQLVSRVCFLVSVLRLSDRKSLGVIAGVGLLAIRGGLRAKETYDSLEVSIGQSVEARGCSKNSQPRYNLAPQYSR